MYTNRKLLITLTSVVFLLSTVSLNPFQKTYNRLYGKIQCLQETDLKKVYVPLNNLNIEILTIQREILQDGQQVRTPKEIVKSTAPDTGGYFTFFDIDEGTYFLRVSMLNVVLTSDLYLDEVRVIYDNKRCNLPVINIELEKGIPVHELDIRINNTSKYVGDNKWDWRIFVEAPLEVIDKIECVEYNLHPTFSTRFWKICRDNEIKTKYPFSPPTFRGWGTFNVPVRILFKDGKICYLDHKLAFDLKSIRLLL